ncbi:MAG: c-type cytochrome [Gemmatimonadales bacterium]
MHAVRRAAGAVLPSLVAAVILAGAAGSIARAQEDEPKITDELIAWGKRVYFGAPSCVTCHGAKGEGTDEAPDLTDDEWLHGDGSLAAIIKVITEGVSHVSSKTGREMPMRGWAGSASDAEVRAVAAYVWSLSHRH